jgi:choline-sulfatase
MDKIDRRTVLSLLTPAAAGISLLETAHARTGAPAVKTSGNKPNVLFLMTDQQRFDTIAALGNSHIYTPNLDRLVKRGLTFSNAYSQCPVCVPARYTIRTGCEPPTTRVFFNGYSKPVEGQVATMTGRCGPYLAQTMQSLGYRTFGIGKFHTSPVHEDLGYQVHLHSEEMYGTPQNRQNDAFASWIAAQHPEYDFIEALMGERTEMYYMPQMSPMPAAVTVEGWAAARAIEQIHADRTQPYFGFVSFIGPHPPFAPPIPFNRMYDPDRMPNPVRGKRETDHMDEQIPFMNYGVWAEDINDPHARVLKARYYGEVSYIDHCIGRILDAVEARPDAENTLICFFADHGDHLGDHSAWQKESFFEASCHIPFLVSWPARLKGGARRDDLVCLTDLFGIATRAAGKAQLREGIDILGSEEAGAEPRQSLFGYYGLPGAIQFKIMVRHREWKYIFMANGGREQLFNLREDPNELVNLAEAGGEIARQLRGQAAARCDRNELRAALASGGLREFPFQPRSLKRIYQFDRSRGVTGFPLKPGDVLAS